MSDNGPRHDRDSMMIRGERILHSTLRRDWCCGICGSPLSTFYAITEGWHTACCADHSHDPGAFMTRASWDYRQAQRRHEQAEAREVFAYLPADVRAQLKS